jgi:hypothetical protein
MVWSLVTMNFADLMHTDDAYPIPNSDQTRGTFRLSPSEFCEGVGNRERLGEMSTGSERRREKEEESGREGEGDGSARCSRRRGKGRRDGGDRAGCSGWETEQEGVRRGRNDDSC